METGTRRAWACATLMSGCWLLGAFAAYAQIEAAAPLGRASAAAGAQLDAAHAARADVAPTPAREENRSAHTNAKPPVDDGQGGPVQGGGRFAALSEREFLLSLIVLSFGLIVLVLQYLLLRAQGARADDILRVFSLTLIIIATMFGLTAGFSSTQIAPAVGLFGTLAGYLLGRRPTAGGDGDSPQTSKGASS